MVHIKVLDVGKLGAFFYLQATNDGNFLVALL